MGSNNVPFGGKGRPINPRFSLNNDPEGVETEDFTPKKNVGSFAERVQRPVPKPLDSSADSGPVFIPTGTSQRRVSPNSLFSGEDESLSLDIGVNETDTDTSSSSPVNDVPRGDVEVRPVSPPPVMTPPTYGVPKTFNTPSSPRVGFANDDELSLDIGVNETEETSPVDSYASEEGSEPENENVLNDIDFTAEDEDKELSLDVGVNETDDVSYAPVEGEKAVEEVERPVMESPVPVRKPVPPSVANRPRSINPLFADPSPEVKEEPLSLDVGVNETEEAPAKRVISPLFDFKSDGFNPPARKVSVRQVRPDSMIDTGSVEDFEEKKSGRGKKKVAEPTRRPFQIQERDITLLRFLTKYQFSYVDALARVLDSTPQSITKRLRTLEEYDLVKRQNIAAGSTLWQARKAGIELAGMNFKENKRAISFATIRHTIGLVNLAAELEREAAGSKDILGLGDKFGEQFPVMNRFPGGIRLYGEEAAQTPLTYGEMTVAEREIRQGQKRYRGGRSSSEMRDIVDFAILNPEAPELEPGNEGLFVVYGSGGKTGEHVPDLVVTRPRDENGKPQHFAIELELTPKSPNDWKRILRSYRDNGGMYSRIYYFTSDRPIANMIKNADEEVGLGERLVLRKYTPKNKRQPFLG